MSISYSVQVFEAIEIREYPYFLTIEASDGELVKDIINYTNSHKVYLLVDHDTKRIWNYNGPKSSLKLQIFGGILAGMLRKQLRGFYRIYSLNRYTPEDDEFIEILNKPIGEGRATTIEKDDFPSQPEFINESQISIKTPKMNQALEEIGQYPTPSNYDRIFLLIRNTIYTEEEIVESILTEKKTAKKEVKLGQLNNGFNFFNDRNYSVRFIVKHNEIQGLELFVPKHEEIPLVKLKTSVIKEVKYSRSGDMNSLVKAFKIPETNVEEEVIVHEIKDLDQ
jgi:hypothetical protein